MAKVHVHVRLQVNGSNEQVEAIAAAAVALQAAVEAAGGEWKGGAAAVELDGVESEAAPDAPSNTGEEEDADVS